MSKPRKEVEDKGYFKDIHFLYKIINSLKNVEEIKLFLKDMLTSAELRMFKRRWHIAIMLGEGYDIRTVADKTKTSTQTVSRIKQIMDEGRGGLHLALRRMEREVYVEGVSKGIKSNVKRLLLEPKYVKGWFK